MMNKLKIIKKLDNQILKQKIHFNNIKIPINQMN